MMDNNSPIVVTIVGPESSGKTTLALHVADAVGGRYVPEAARPYLEAQNRSDRFDDLAVITREQTLLLEDIIQQMGRPISFPALSGDLPPIGSYMDEKKVVDWLKKMNHPVIIVDNGVFSIRMWAEIKYQREIPGIQEALDADPTFLFLLKRPLHVWHPDPLRESPKLVDRVWIYVQYYHQLMVDKRYFLTV